MRSAVSIFAKAFEKHFSTPDISDKFFSISYLYSADMRPFSLT